MTREPVDWPTEDLLAHRARATPERIALIDADRDEQWTYRNLHGKAGWQARALAYRGVEPGDTLGLLLTAGVSFVELVHAAMRLRATLVPLNVALPTGQLAAQVDRADPDRLLCQSDTEAAAVELVDPESVYSIHAPEHGAAGKLDRPTTSLGDLEPIARDRTQLVLFTSGTTGEPKGVRLTAGNLLASASASAFRLGVERGDRWLDPLPPYHMGGLAPLIRSALYGTAVVLQREFDAGATAEAVVEHGITGVSLVPTMLKRLLDVGWDPPAHLRFALVGGAPTPPELVERCRDRGVPVFPSYGATEAASQIATATPQQAFDHPGTVGQPLVFTDVTILDDGRRCDPGETGEVVVDGPTVSPGYLDEEYTREAFCDRGLRTGDLGYRDEDGRLWVVGRADDAVVTGGETVHPSTVVDALCDHPSVEDAAVVGLDDPEWGERVAALVVPDGDLDLDDLEAHCRRRLAGFEVPKTWVLADELPRTPSGTVDRGAVRERLRGE